MVAAFQQWRAQVHTRFPAATEFSDARAIIDAEIESHFPLLEAGLGSAAAKELHGVLKPRHCLQSGTIDDYIGIVAPEIPAQAARHLLICTTVQSSLLLGHPEDPTAASVPICAEHGFTLVLPCHHGPRDKGHWTLMIATLLGNKDGAFELDVVTLDSLEPGAERKNHTMLVKAIWNRFRAALREQGNKGKLAWKLRSALETAFQGNSVDCGVHVCYWIKQLVLATRRTPTQSLTQLLQPITKKGVEIMRAVIVAQLLVQRNCLYLVVVLPQRVDNIWSCNIALPSISHGRNGKRDSANANLSEQGSSPKKLRRDTGSKMHVDGEASPEIFASYSCLMEEGASLGAGGDASVGANDAAAADGAISGLLCLPYTAINCTKVH